MTLSILKLGGSYADYSGLKHLVATIAEGRGRAVLVPGGGPFADAVRQGQTAIGYDDRAAHRMALLAMAQFGHALASFSAHLQPVDLAGIAAALDSGRLPVWLPVTDLSAETDIEESWQTTSDSMAVWLAGRLGAARIIFLKRMALSHPASASALVRDGILDRLVPGHLARTGVEAWLCDPQDVAGLGRALAEGLPIGTRIDPA